jgi:hypothetical protein
MKVAIQLIPEDITIFNKFVSGETRFRRIRTVLFWVAVIVVILAGLILSPSRHRLDSGMIANLSILAGGALLVYLLTIWKLNRNTKQQFAENPGLAEAEELEINEEGLRSITASSESMQKWNVFVSYGETKDLFAIFHSPKLARLIPKRAFKDETQVLEMRNLLATNIGAVYPKRRFAQVASDRSPS